MPRPRYVVPRKGDILDADDIAPVPKGSQDGRRGEKRCYLFLPPAIEYIGVHLSRSVELCLFAEDFTSDQCVLYQGNGESLPPFLPRCDA
jgi:hypothetical protein